MIQTLNLPYSSKTDEIMSRYRPIAPKPELPTNNNNNNSTNPNNSNTNNYDTTNGALVPEKFRQSPYLRNIWSHLQARPTRTRKRGRGSGISPAAAAALLRKQQEQQHGQQQHQPQLPHSGVRQTFMGLCSARNLSMQAFGIYATDYHQHTNNNNNNNECNNDSVHIYNNNNNNNNDVKSNNNNNVVELPLLSCPMLSSKPIDLNIDAMDISSSALDETDLQLQLQVSTGSSSNKTTKGVISPRPVRPVGSTITIVGPINENKEATALVKAHHQVEAEAEEEALPAVITDRGNKVRMVNSAYKELVGQPECLWLDTMTMCTGGRISGEVMLQLKESRLPASSNGFSCWVRIEWESNGKKNSVNAYCQVVKLVCMSKDYLFSWRFHTREVSPSGSSKV